MSRWERLEEFLFDYDKAGGEFTVHEYAAEIGLDTSEGTDDIQSYLRAQRSSKSTTLYVIKRNPATRTTTARWSVGVRTRDARLVGKTLYEDTRVKVKRAFMPDLVRIGSLNPRAKHLVEAQVDAVIDGAMKVLEMAVVGSFGEEE